MKHAFDWFRPILVLALLLLSPRSAQCFCNPQKCRMLVNGVSKGAMQVLSTKYENGQSLIYYGYRYYNASGGRWLSRDSLDEKGGPNLYCSVHNDQVDSFDPQGMITVTTITADPKTTCGSADGVDFNFTLDKPATQDGYIVQENTVSIPWVSGILNGNLWNDHYWEAWLVKKNERSPTTQAAANYTDHVTWEGKDDASGGGGIKGTIKFFFATRTGNLGDPGANPPIAPGQSSGWVWNNSSPSSGRLPSTRNPDTVSGWWNKPPDDDEGTAERSVTVQWDCTCANKTSSIKVSP